MEHTTEHAEPPQPSGTMVRDHWNMYSRFTSWTKGAIVGVIGLGAFVTVVVLLAT